MTICTQVRNFFLLCILYVYFMFTSWGQLKSILLCSSFTVRHACAEDLPALEELVCGLTSADDMLSDVRVSLSTGRDPGHTHTLTSLVGVVAGQLVALAILRGKKVPSYILYCT